MIALVAAATALLSLQPALDERAAGAPGTGIAVGVIDHGVQRIYVAGGAGNGRPVDAHTLFEIGSVTKTFTATVLAAMVLAGQVRLRDPIAEYLPKGVRAPGKDGKPITLLDLAEQRSGLPRLPANMSGAGFDDPYASYTVADMYAFFDGYTLSRDPGSAYEYSNYGIGLLGQLLARRAKTTYPALVRRRVLDPLAMTRTAFVMAGLPDPARLAVGHDLSGTPLPAWHFRAIAPAGGMASSVSDMLKYLHCNMGQGPLARACLFAQQPRAAGEPRHQIGLVWNVNSSNGAISHGGDTYGFHAFVAISRDRQTGVVALSNGPAVADIAAHVLVPAYPIATCPPSVAAAQTDPGSYAGVYCNQSGGLVFTVTAFADPDRLSIALRPQPAATVTRTGKDTYALAAAGATFEFVRDDGKVVGLWLRQHGQTIPARRLSAQGTPVVERLAAPFPLAIALDPSVLQQYAGTYASSVGTFTVTARDGTLYVQLTGQPAVAVYASAKDRFFYKVVDAQISFGRDASGAVTSLTLHQNGHIIHAARVGRR